MINELIASAEKRMNKSIDALGHELAKVRTGRAHPGFLEHVMVPYYGNDTPLNQVANVSVADGRTLVVTPWEKTMLAPVEKAILNANLGLNPASVGQSIRVPMPPLTEERRRELTKVVKSTAEHARVSVRNTRRDANGQLKEAVKDKAISEDEERRGQESIQKLTDKFIANIDQVAADKEADLMAV